MAAGEGSDSAGPELRRRRFGLALACLTLSLGLYAAEPPAQSEDPGLQAMARLQPGLRRGHVALYFGGEVAAQGLGLPAETVVQAARAPAGQVAFRFSLPGRADALTITLPPRGAGNYPVGPVRAFSSDFAQAPLEGTVHFERFDPQALSGWFFLRRRDGAGQVVQTAGGAFREIPWAEGLR